LRRFNLGLTGATEVAPVVEFGSLRGSIRKVLTPGGMMGANDDGDQHQAQNYLSKRHS
jgi:hypothetical protein